jgi:ketosteroid isomerase-like protein
MRRGLIALAALASQACAHAAPTPSSCPAPAQAITDVAQTMRDMYAALKSDDVNAFRTVTTKDFLAYDVGQRFDGDALINLIKDRHAEGVVFEWRVNDPKVEVDCDTALVTYVNTGSVTRVGARRDVSWLESATLRHDGQRWRIRFFHSTQVPPAARPQ